MILPDVPSSLLLLSVLGALAGMILFLKFLHELSLTVRDLEPRNREAQRDLFLILKNHLGLREIPVNRQSKTAPQKNRPVPYENGNRCFESMERADAMTQDEIRLLLA